MINPLPERLERTLLENVSSVNSKGLLGLFIIDPLQMYRQNTSIMIRLKWREMKMDPEEWLRMIVLKRGEVSSVYGGFEIWVINPSSFPWYQVFEQLIEIGHEVWISRKKDKIHISSKPEAP